MNFKLNLKHLEPIILIKSESLYLRSSPYHLLEYEIKKIQLKK